MPTLIPPQVSSTSQLSNRTICNEFLQRVDILKSSNASSQDVSVYNAVMMAYQRLNCDGKVACDTMAPPPTNNNLQTKKRKTSLHQEQNEQTVAHLTLCDGSNLSKSSTNGAGEIGFPIVAIRPTNSFLMPGGFHLPGLEQRFQQYLRSVGVTNLNEHCRWLSDHEEQVNNSEFGQFPNRHLETGPPKGCSRYHISVESSPLIPERVKEFVANVPESMERSQAY